MSLTKKAKISLGSFDLIKGLCMILIVLHHSTNDYDVTQPGILSFLITGIRSLGFGVIPLFFLVSGFGFKEKSPGVILKKTFSDYIVPYLWLILATVICYAIPNYPVYDSWSKTFYNMFCDVLTMLLGITNGGTFLGFPLSWCTAAWFLLASFVAFNVLNLILKIKNIALQVLCVIVSAVVGQALFRVNFYYYCIPQGLVAVGFCYVGHILKKYNLFERISTSAWTYIILIPITIAESLWGHFDLCPGEFNNLVLDYFGAGCFGLFYMLAGFYVGKLEWKCLDWIKQIGIYTYWIICAHSFEEAVVPLRLFTGWMKIPVLMMTGDLVLRTAIIIFVCYFLKQLTKFKYQRRLGRNGK